MLSPVSKHLSGPIRGQEAMSVTNESAAVAICAMLCKLKHKQGAGSGWHLLPPHYHCNDWGLCNQLGKYFKVWYQILHLGYNSVAGLFFTCHLQMDCWWSISQCNSIITPEGWRVYQILASLWLLILNCKYLFAIFSISWPGCIFHPLHCTMRHETMT